MEIAGYPDQWVDIGDSRLEITCQLLKLDGTAPSMPAHKDLLFPISLFGLNMFTSIQVCVNIEKTPCFSVIYYLGVFEPAIGF